jgi:hypothetical protein
VTGSNTLPLRQLIASKSLRQLIASNSKTSRKPKSEALVTRQIARNGRSLVQRTGKPMVLSTNQSTTRPPIHPTYD